MLAIEISQTWQKLDDKEEAGKLERSLREEKKMEFKWVGEKIRGETAKGSEGGKAEDWGRVFREVSIKRLSGRRLAGFMRAKWGSRTEKYCMKNWKLRCPSSPDGSKTCSVLHYKRK